MKNYVKKEGNFMPSAEKQYIDKSQMKIYGLFHSCNIVEDIYCIL